MRLSRFNFAILIVLCNIFEKSSSEFLNATTQLQPGEAPGDRLGASGRCLEFRDKSLQKKCMRSIAKGATRQIIEMIPESRFSRLARTVKYGSLVLGLARCFALHENLQLPHSAAASSRLSCVTEQNMTATVVSKTAACQYKKKRQMNTSYMILNWRKTIFFIKFQKIGV